MNFLREVIARRLMARDRFGSEGAVTSHHQGMQQPAHSANWDGVVLVLVVVVVVVCAEANNSLGQVRSVTFELVTVSNGLGGAVCRAV
jgi:Ca2+/H+ antiporter